MDIMGMIKKNFHHNNLEDKHAENKKAREVEYSLGILYLPVFYNILS